MEKFHFTRKVFTDNQYDVGAVGEFDENEILALEGGPNKIERAIFGHRESKCPRGKNSKIATYCHAFASGNDVAERASKETDEEEADLAGTTGPDAQGDGSPTGDSTFCEACGKEFDSSAALATHRKQKKH